MMLKMENKNSKETKQFHGYFLAFNELIFSLIGIFGALVCVLTMVIAIPIPVTQGFINIGDAGVMITALLFGPVIGSVAGGIGSGLADILLGYPLFAPGTFIIKAIEGLIIGLIADPKRYGEKLNYRDIIGVVVGGLWMSFGYLLYEILLFGLGPALYELLLNGIIQFGISGLISLIFIAGTRNIINQNLPQVFEKVFLTIELEDTQSVQKT
ncbi:MAG: ECF transporter S component [Candidatus Lokiarchaeota archaeon]|nr:ECF transporter S component [Candidatus Lokiarchaeota archaeon]MBD3199531.1 ECF transporter S component [Candidatus Lokiarchaeota archaeon]